jgi:hypothetical protein
MCQPLSWKWRECLPAGGEAATPNNLQRCLISQQKRFSDTLDVNFAILDRRHFAVVFSASSRRRKSTWSAPRMIIAAGDCTGVLRRAGGFRSAATQR